MPTSDDIDLFGNPMDLPEQRAAERPPINDMCLIEKVLQFAENQGYVLVGPSERVYRMEARNEIEAAPAYEADAVTQLITARWLTKGGNHVYQCDGHIGPGNSVLVPASTKAKARKWRALAPLASRHTTAKGRTA